MKELFAKQRSSVISINARGAVVFIDIRYNFSITIGTLYCIRIFGFSFSLKENSEKLSLSGIVVGILIRYGEEASLQTMLPPYFLLQGESQ